MTAANSPPTTQWARWLLAPLTAALLTSCAVDSTSSPTQTVNVGPNAAPAERGVLAQHATAYLAEHPAPPPIGKYGSGYGVVTSVAAHYGAIIAVTPGGFTVVAHDVNCDTTYMGSDSDSANFDQVVEPGDVIVWLFGSDDRHGNAAVCVNEVRVLVYGAVHG